MKYETINNQLCRMVEQPCPHCGQPEIIAERVEDNSHWWALWQMQNGKAVCHTKAPSIKYSMPTHYVKRRVRENCTDDMSIEVWLSGADEFGWRIYEPEPEQKESPIDPIERPLRNLILEAKEKGVNIRTWYQDLIFTPESLTSYLGNGKYRWWNIGNWELTKRKANMPMPEPEPAKEQFAVGDWVTDGAVQGRVVTRTSDTTWVEVQDGKQYHIETSHLRKLSPTEVVVHIGCLKGTVAQCGDKEEEVFALRTKNNAAIIPVAMLDTATRELVESLLKAQEDK